MTRLRERRLRERVANWAMRLRVRPQVVSVQPLGSKWGACTAAGAIMLASDLMDQEPAFQDFVIVHELLHLRVPNHGRVFKAMMNAYVPDWRAFDTGSGCPATPPVREPNPWVRDTRSTADDRYWQGLDELPPDLDLDLDELDAGEADYEGMSSDYEPDHETEGSLDEYLAAVHHHRLTGSQTYAWDTEADYTNTLRHIADAAPAHSYPALRPGTTDQALAAAAADAYQRKLELRQRYQRQPKLRQLLPVRQNASRRSSPGGVIR